MNQARHIKQQGFTLIELVMVILILGILAATAIPKFIDMRTDAAKGAVEGVAGSLAAASALNKAARTLNALTGVTVTNCTSLAIALDGGLNVKYTITSLAIANNATATCTVTGEQSQTATFIGHGIT